MTVARVMPEEETVGDRRMDRAVADEKHICAGAFRHPPCQSSISASAKPRRSARWREMRGDHVAPARLGERRRGRGIGPPIFGHVQANAAHPLGGIEIARPVPRGDGEMDRAGRRRNAHHLRSAPGDGTDISVGQIVPPQHLRLGGVDVVDGPGDFEIEDATGFLQTARMLGRLEDPAAVGALALEHRACVVERMGQHMHLGVAPGDDPPSSQIHPSRSSKAAPAMASHSRLDRR